MHTALIPLDIFGYRDEEDNVEDMKIAFSTRNVVEGGPGAALGLAGGGLVGSEMPVNWGAELAKKSLYLM